MIVVSSFIFGCGITPRDETYTSILTGAKVSVWDGRIFDARERKLVDFEMMLDNLSDRHFFVFGEKHYTPKIQSAEARTTEALVQKNNAYERFSFGWEFLSIREKERVQFLYKKLLQGDISESDFLKETQGQTGPEVESYVPVISAIKSLKGALFATNLSRKERAEIVRVGLENVNPDWIPEGFALGGDFYYERFKEAMQNHTPEQALKRYFEAQCLTDDVMADAILTEGTFDLRFLLVGAFHSDYFDGTVERLRIRLQNEHTSAAVIDFVDASDYKEEDLMPLLIHSKYGPISDYVYFVNEPRL